MNKTKLIILMLLIITVLVILFPLTVDALSLENAEYYKPEEITKGDVDQAYKFGAVIAATIEVIGTAVSIGAMIIIGIKYVAASADEKAEYKERMLPYLIGAILLFGASNIVNIIYQIVKN